MISGLFGKVIKKEIAFVDILTSGGVAYRVYTSLNCRAAIKKEEVFLK